MSDGSRLHQSWYSAVNEAEAYFRQLLTSPSNEWRRISSSTDNSGATSKKGKARVAGAAPELADAVVHRNSNTSGGEDVYRVVLDVPVVEEQVSLEPWKAVLTTPELRREWDPAVEEAHLLEVLDRSTQISKTNFSLGWPANPRDAITISRSFSDPTTVINISTSLPRSPDEPAYLRPSPPFVRSHVHLFAWCIQHTQAQPDSSTPGKLRMTCFWQHDFREMWGMGSSSSSLAQQLSTMALSLFKTVLKRGGRVPKLIGYGNGVSIERIRFQIDREALSVDYAIIPDDDSNHVSEGTSAHGMEDLHQLRENKRLTRSIECVLPSLEGWDVQVSLKASSEEVEQLPWSAQAIKANSNPSAIGPPDQILLRLTHSALMDDHSVLKVHVVIEASGGTRGLRLNGLPKKILDLSEQRDPSSYTIPQQMLRDVASAADLSFATSSSVSSMSGHSSSMIHPVHATPSAQRTAAAEKSILSRVKRNYIYFSSLLQEPEAKWRRTTEARGVSITQLDSIDPTLVVYRAEATFVGVGLWDLYGAVTSPGARGYWDKQHEDAVLLEDVNELTELWHFKTKPAWPVNGRDSVVLKTVYKSPTTIHVFAFSADDPHLFPNIPPAEPTVIRTQVDLQGWSIEALSPTTTSLTLLEQSDPKGWTNKTSIPTQMINTLAGIGEFAIKCGGPPIVTRLTGAKANEMRYDHEKGSFRVEYEASSSRRQVVGPSGEGNGSGAMDSEERDDSSQPTIECEIRCDVDTWASSLDIVVDPPPHTMSCLRRHRLSAEGGGLWLTLTHDCVFVDDERHLVIVRRAPGKEKGLVMVNGSKIHVDVEAIPEEELKALRKKERVKPPRIPLDQPPVVGVVRRRKAEWGDEGQGEDAGKKDGEEGQTVNALSSWASAPRISSPLSRFLSYAVDQATTTTQQAVAAITPAGGGGSSLPSATKMPMQYALEALAWTQEFHSSAGFLSSSVTDGWTLVSDKEAMTVHRKLIPEASSIVPVHKGQKVVEGVSGEELAAIIMEGEGRKEWDDRFDSIQTLESFGNSCKTMFLTAKGGFPFRDRGFYVSSVTARTQAPPATASSRRNTGDVAEQTGLGAKNAIFVVAASFAADSATSVFSPEKHNPYVLPIGRVYIDAWVLETLDPYTKENYAIPSTRCTRLVAVDYAGSIPAAVNSMINASLPRAILALEAYFKKSVSCSSLPVIRLPAPCLVLAEKKGEDRLASVSWKLRKRDEGRVLVGEKFASAGEGPVGTGTGVGRVYKARVFVTLVQPKRGGHPRLGEPSKTPRPPAARMLSMSPRPGIKEREASSERSVLGASPSLAAPSITGGSVASTSSTSLAPSRTPELSTSSSVETLRSVRSQDGPLNRMPGTMVFTPPKAGSPASGSPASVPLSRQRSVSSSSTLTGMSFSAHHTQYATTPPEIAPSLVASRSSPSYPSTNSVIAGASSHMRGRTMSSAFTAKGEVKPVTDLIVGEVVVDTRMYPDGYYVVVRSWKVSKKSGETREAPVWVEFSAKGKGKELDGEVYLKLGGGWSGDGKTMIASPPSVTASSSSSSGVSTSSSVESAGASSSTSVSGSGASAPAAVVEEVGEERFLPLAYSIYTMPASPMHSSSLNVEAGATRHLLRISLPTAQYQVSSVRDPLTGETRKGPKKPEWMKVLEGSDEEDIGEDGEKGDDLEEELDIGIDLEEEEEKPVVPKRARLHGAVVDIEILPVAKAEEEKEKEKDGKKKRIKRVGVNGLEVPVVGEKESLTSLGREELLDDRISKMPILFRTPNETEALPEELRLPMAVADDLVDPAVRGDASGSNAPASAAFLHPDGDLSKDSTGRAGGDAGTKGGEDIPGMPSSNTASTSTGLASGSVISGGPAYAGGWSLWSSYRFGFGLGGAGASSTTLEKPGSEQPTRKLPGEIGEGEDGANAGGGTTQLGNGEGAKGTGGEKEGVETGKEAGEKAGVSPAALVATQGRPGMQARQYPLATLVIVALIAFLIGSLLRSLLSPADFIYVVTNMKEAEEANKVSGGGWREIRRLLEIKYILGGWDFQIAAVRRHM
ncbi:hypothetical protein DFP72DRAFT_966746 [Ephemerocybe angulata]|uniref:START domain-containing protein n=1 Tax=Ephemerocybe angulata TaxID=980116 RepID=A0A8H6HVQ7_9AGAR|nr:hypothetical protein DFP72DRAFT_966746 [Tulosesus angulatus]